MKIILNVSNRNTNSQTFRGGESLVIHDIHLSASPRLFCVVLDHIYFRCSSEIVFIELTGKQNQNHHQNEQQPTNRTKNPNQKKQPINNI